MPMLDPHRKNFVPDPRAPRQETELNEAQTAALHKMVRTVNRVYANHEDTMRLLDARTDLIEAFNL